MSGERGKGLYKRIPYELGKETSVLQSDPAGPKIVKVRRRLPGNIIVVHGVNDVGTSYKAIEEGLCQGLAARLFRGFKAGTYSNPTAVDKDELKDDPDAFYYKRSIDADTNSPVIPFYWGYRETKEMARSANGQNTDRYGTRLDKDLSKGGGPFGNATSTLPDMWNKGICAPVDVVGDPLRPLVSAPGRMYMVLAASRLAALIAMIRDYDEAETVTIVAHSQGCMLSLLAQALLMDRGLRPADTLILTHPPYSLEEDMSWIMKASDLMHSGIDAVMNPFYGLISARQTVTARLRTLVNIVRGVAAGHAAAALPQFASLNNNQLHRGAVEAPWKAEADRDNRGKVYLYFCPEDMTVALDNIQGIGWQGVPDMIPARPPQMVFDRATGRHRAIGQVGENLLPLQALGGSFHQRVFTGKTRHDPVTRKLGPVLVGQPPHDFVLRLRGEDDHAHVESSGRDYRSSLPVATWPLDPNAPPERRQGIRRINGEALARPVRAELRGNQIDPDKIPKWARQSKLASKDKGPCEEVDMLDAATAIAGGALKRWTEERPDPAGYRTYPGSTQELPLPDVEKIATAYNREKHPDVVTIDPNDMFRILRAVRHVDGKVVATIEESPNAGRLRWQHELSAKSFHGAIIGNSENHCNVTAYDVAIGGGMASSDPNFYRYLCAVADWRLKKPGKGDLRRPGIPIWEEFLTLHKDYWFDEPAWRQALIKGSVNYYSTGELPVGLPILSGSLWDIVISETIKGVRVKGR